MVRDDEQAAEGRKNASKRWDGDPLGKPLGKPKATPNGLSESESESESEGKEGDARGGPPGCLATEAFTSAWAEYETYRRESKLKKLVPRSVKSQWNKLETYGHGTAIESIKNTIANGWQGLFDPRDGQKPGRPDPNVHVSPNGIELWKPEKSRLDKPPERKTSDA